MVPYVRKSFRKHYVDGLTFVEGIENICRSDIPQAMEIDAEEYKARPKVYEYAIAMTVQEVYQAVEGMFHNLNTLQSRSGNQLN